MGLSEDAMKHFNSDRSDRLDRSDHNDENQAVHTTCKTNTRTVFRGLSNDAIEFFRK